MNREILFRGKRIDNGEWVYGLVWKKKYNSDRICISYFPNEDDEEAVVRVSPETVCQYTGLTDKNGRKIFENDICKDGTNIVRILWNDSHHQWGVEISKTECILNRGLIFPLWQYDNCEMNGYRELEIIGNVFDNPELLKEGV